MSNLAFQTVNPIFRAYDLNGHPLKNGRVFTYEKGSTTIPKATWQDENKTIPNTNPVILSHEGTAKIYLDGTYNMVVMTKHGSLVWSDNVSDPAADAVEEVIAALFTDNVKTLKDIDLTTLSDGQVYHMKGYHNIGDGGGGQFYWDSASTEADNGGTIFNPTGHTGPGRWIRLNTRNMTVLHWGAQVGQESSDSIQAAFDYIRNDPKQLPDIVDFGENTHFYINKPIKGCMRCEVVGNTVIEAQAPFDSVTFTIKTGGTFTVGAMLYFVEGTVIGNSGIRIKGLKINHGIQLQCAKIAGVGVFLNDYQYYDIHCLVFQPTKWGIFHYYGGWGGTVGSKVFSPAEGGVYLKDADNGVTLDNVCVFGETQKPSVSGILLDGDNNGLEVNGGFIEIANQGILIRNGGGAITINGVDFEKIDNENVFVDGTVVPTRINGPVTINGCFMETSSPTASLVKSINSTIDVTGCRMRSAASAFDQIGSGSIMAKNNHIEPTVTKIYAERNFLSNQVVNRGLVNNYHTLMSTPLENVNVYNNYNHNYDTSIKSSGVTYTSAITNSPTKTMINISDWSVGYFINGAQAGNMGVTLDYRGGGTNKYFTPLDDGETHLGKASARWKDVYSTNGTIITSDRTMKENITQIPDNVLQAWKTVNFKQYNMIGESRLDFGIIAQDIIDAFKAKGINALDYGLVTCDTWTDDGLVDDRDPKPYPSNIKKSGTVYGVRYHQCLVLELELIRRGI